MYPNSRRSPFARAVFGETYTISTFSSFFTCLTCPHETLVAREPIRLERTGIHLFSVAQFTKNLPGRRDGALVPGTFRAPRETGGEPRRRAPPPRRKALARVRRFRHTYVFPASNARRACTRTSLSTCFPGSDSAAAASSGSGARAALYQNRKFRRLQDPLRARRSQVLIPALLSQPRHVTTIVIFTVGISGGRAGAAGAGAGAGTGRGQGRGADVSFPQRVS